MIEALRLTSDANRLLRAPVLQGHKVIRKNNGAVKSMSDFANGNKIKGTLRSIKDKSERLGRERMCQTNTFSHSLRTIS